GVLATGQGAFGSRGGGAFIAPGRGRYGGALSGPQRLFFRVQRPRRIARDIVATLTATRWLAFHATTSSPRLASGVARNWATRAASCARGIPRGRPGVGFAAGGPPWGTRRTQFLDRPPA